MSSPALPLLFDILTIFPDMFRGVLDESIVKRAMEKGLVQVNTMDLRDYAQDKHRSVDDYLYGGIPGMLLQCEPVVKALHDACSRRQEQNPRVIYLSPQGQMFNHRLAAELALENSLVLLCGRYKGVDERIVRKYVDLEVSVGDYVLSGGELPAMLLVDAVTRLLPGALGDRESAESDSLADGLLEAPNYTRPEEFEGMRVPEVLLSGHHENIRKWRMEQSVTKTLEKRPDLHKKWLDQQQSGDREENTKL